jgi:integrase
VKRGLRLVLEVPPGETRHISFNNHMSGRRPLTSIEERRLLRVVRRLKPRDRALITAQWLTGFRISEILSLHIGEVWRNGTLVPKIGIRPGHLKGGYGSTRWVPVSPELARALETYLAHLRRRYELTPDLPLFVSRQDGDGGIARPLHRDSARLIVRAAFAKAGIKDDGRLGSHSLRKAFARAVYDHSGHDLNLTRAALGHGNIAVTQRYLEVDEDRLFEAMAAVDFTRRSRAKEKIKMLAPGPIPAQLELLPAATPPAIPGSCSDGSQAA